MVLFWEIFFWTIPAFVFLLIPFMTFFYEADDGLIMAGTTITTQKKSRLCEALKYEFVVILIFGTLFVVGYLLLGEAEVPIQVYKGSIPGDDTIKTTPNNGNNTFVVDFLAPMDEDLQNYAIFTEDTKTQEDLLIQVNIPTFFAGFMSFFGWFFFALFGGIGLAAVPLDLVLAFIHRPTHMDPSQFADVQLDIRKRVNDLVNIGEMVKLDRDERRARQEGGRWFGGWGKEAREERNTFLEFRKAVFLLEEDVEEFQACSANYESYNPLLPWISLFFGILAFFISVAWGVHIGIYMIPSYPLHPFLNYYFQWFEKWFPLFGVLSVAVFTLYLLLAAVKGCFKFGIRFMFFEIHPMKVNKTYMSSFMFNVGLILLCCLPVVQFCTTAFADYARYTNIAQVMGTQVQNLKVFTWFWTSNVFVYAMVSVAGLTIIYLFCKPRDRSGIDSLSLRERVKGNKIK